MTETRTRGPSWATDEIGVPPEVIQPEDEPAAKYAALSFLTGSTTRDEAQHWAQIAVQRGATPAHLVDAWAWFDKYEDERSTKR